MESDDVIRHDLEGKLHTSGSKARGYVDIDH